MLFKNYYKQGIEINQQSVKLEIIYQDDFLLVINKPSGLHSISQNDSTKIVTETMTTTAGNIAKILASEHPEQATFGNEAGLLQRLDLETSGCLLIARTESALSLIHI